MAYILGLDIGYSNMKLAWGERGAINPTVLLRPAGTAPAERVAIPLASTEEGRRVMVNEQAWMAGVAQERLGSWNRALHPNFTSTDDYLSLFYAALWLTGRARIDRLVTGLPVSQYYGDKARRAALAQRLQGRHQLSEQWQVEVGEVKVVAQPLGGYFDGLWSRLAPDQAGALQLFQEARVLVVDPGFFSLDWVLVMNGSVYHQACGTSQEASSVVLEELDRLINEAHGGQLGRERLEQALRTGKNRLGLFGHWVELGDYLPAAIAATAPNALTAIQDSLRKQQLAIDVLLLVGGGAGFFEAAAQAAFPKSQVMVAKAPVYANARGFYFAGQP